MTILDHIKRTGPKAPRICIYGRPGIGKSTLTASFPSPLFILTEETGLENIDALPVFEEFTSLWSAVKQLISVEDLPYKTIVVDSITKLDNLIVRYILDDPANGKRGEKATTLTSACGGYGAGYSRAEALHRAFKAMLDKLQDRGITVIYVSHVAVKTVKTPDHEDYEIYTITANNDKTRSVYLDDVDLVGFCRLKSHITETESGRNLIKSTGDRVIVVGCSENHVSKNRFSMPQEIPMKYEDLAKHIPFYNQTVVKQEKKQ
jgi:hypothetical protein